MMPPPLIYHGLMSFFLCKNCIGNCFIDRSEFDIAHRQVFPDGSPEEVARTFDHFDQDHDGKVDYVAW